MDEHKYFGYKIVQFKYVYGKKSLQSLKFPSDVTYGENLVKDNSITPSAGRQRKHE